MAANILRSGTSLVAYDQRPEPLRELVAQGGIAATSVEEVATSCDVMFVCLPSQAASDSVAAEAFSASLGRPKAYVELSTLGPDMARDISARANEAGISFLDAPVSGGVQARLDGTLTVMAGGELDAFELVRPIIETFSKNVFLLGPVGSGSIAKISNNLIALTKLVTALEGILLGIRSGIPVEKLCEVIMASSGGCSAVLGMSRHYSARRDRRQEAAHAAINIAIKDLKLAIELASRVGIPVRTAQAALDAWQEASDAGLHDAELWALIDHLDPITHC